MHRRHGRAREHAPLRVSHDPSEAAGRDRLSGGRRAAEQQHAQRGREAPDGLVTQIHRVVLQRAD